MKKLVLMAAAAVLTFSLSSAVYADDNTAVLKQQLQYAQARVDQANTLLSQLEAAAGTNPVAAAQVQSVKAGIPALQAEVNRIKALLPAEAPATAATTDPVALMALLAQQQTAATPAAQAAADAATAQAQQLAQSQALLAAQAQLIQAAQAAQAQAAQAQAAQAQTQQAQTDIAAQAQQLAQATTPAVAAAVKNFTDKNGTTHTFTMDEWNYLISVWAYTGQGEEMVTHHTIGDLMAVLAARG
ncbi:MAG: hypothetical protein II799_04860 [Lachnospiraceae bacterium]|nr:hypothetical protein [Lachnospiraceae bacterium]